MTIQLRPLSAPKAWLCVLLACFGHTVFAASLGRINVQSALGESFRADVELLNVSADEMPNLLVKTASPEMFRRQGVDFNPAVLSIKATLVNEATRSFISLRSNDGIQEPLLDLLVEIVSDKGSLIKKYTILLDPPLSKQLAGDIASQQIMANAVQNYVPSTLSLKPSFNLNLRHLKPSPTSKAPSLSKQALKAMKKAQREAAKDVLNVYAPPNLTALDGKESPQALARRLVKSGVNDPAQIEALIHALNAAKPVKQNQSSTLGGKTETAAANASVSSSSALADKPTTTASTSTSTVPQASTLPATSGTLNTTPAATSAIVPAPTTTEPAAPVIAPPVLAASPTPTTAPSWWSSLSDVWLLLAGAIGLLGFLAWLRHSKANSAQDHYPLRDYKPLQQDEKVINAQQLDHLKNDAKPVDTRFFESKFLTEIHTPEPIIEAIDVEPIHHAKQMIAQGETNNAASILKDLLNDNPNDQSVRLMLISLLIDKQDDIELDGHMSQLEKVTDGKGDVWQEANLQYIDYKLKQQTSLDFTLPEAKAKVFSPQATSTLDLPGLTSDRPPSLSLDLTHPTVFAPPAQAGLSASNALDFDISELKKPSSQASHLVPKPASQASIESNGMSAEALAKHLSQLEIHIQKNELAGAQALLKSLAATVEKNKP